MKRIILLALAISFILNTCFVQASLSEELDTIAELTTRILHEEIALERFYLRYKIFANREPKLREIRYFLGQQAALGLFLAGDIVGLNESAKNLNAPQNISIGNLKGSLRAELVGSILGGASSALELCSNTFIAYKNKKNGHDPKTARDTVKAGLEKINALLAKRTYLVNQERTRPSYAINVAEGELLQYYRDWCVYEFAKIYADVRSYQPSANVYYTLNAASYIMYSASGILGLKSFRQTQYISPSIVTSLVGDSLSIISAPAAYVADKMLYKYHFRQVYKKLNERQYDVENASANVLVDLHRHVHNANDETLDQVGLINLRLTAYDLWNLRYDEYIDKEMVQLRRYDKIALQSVFFGPLISTTFLAQDVLAATAYYGDRTHPKTANDLALGGYIAAGAGSIIGLTATAWYFVDEARNQRKLRLEGNLPEQLLEKRLKTLDEIEMLIGP